MYSILDDKLTFWFSDFLFLFPLLLNKLAEARVYPMRMAFPPLLTWLAEASVSYDDGVSSVAPLVVDAFLLASAAGFG